MKPFVLGFHEMDSQSFMLAGGKGFHLGELSEIKGIQVPSGFCLTTEAYKKAVVSHPSYQEWINHLSDLNETTDHQQVSEICAQIREFIEQIDIDFEIADKISDYLSEYNENQSFAIRSSATAEDLPQSSFAGQQDTYLNVIGKAAIFHHIKKCWASLFTDRAVIYRIKNNFDHHHVYLSVVIQQMIFPEASGIVFTAEPMSSNRNILSIDASFGLGESLVSGIVTADNYKVRESKIVEQMIAEKRKAIIAIPQGGTKEIELKADQQHTQVLTDKQILTLAELGKEIEHHFNHPQDIEWCLDNDQFYILQSRPITTLYPVPQETNDENRVYVSMGHSQMMTEAMKPLGISFFQLLSGSVPLHEVGGRLFIDVTHDFASSLGRKVLFGTLGKNDALMKSALSSLLKREDYLKTLPKGKRFLSTQTEGLSLGIFFEMIKIYVQNNPELVLEVISKMEQSIQNLEERIAGLSGEKLFSFILEDQKELRTWTYHPQSMGMIMIGVYARYWLNKQMKKWLGEESVADVLTQSVPYNVTAEMGLALLEVSDTVRKYPDVIEYFQNCRQESFFFDLQKIKEGGSDVHEVFSQYLDKYGMRCTGEIDLTRTRWNENPTALVPLILSNLNLAPNTHHTKFEQGIRSAEQKEKEILTRLKALPNGKRKAKKTEKMIRILRNFTGFREYPKYFIINRFYVYKQALLQEGQKLVENGILQAKEDVYYLSFEELREAVRTKEVSKKLIEQRKEQYKKNEKLTPPRILTSDGEMIFGRYDSKNIPDGALAGLAVSSGVVEGRARVVLKMEEADLEEGDILVTSFTDPSWTPLFVSIKGLVTEVGGLMTHGSVIAREYGLPAVVGVEGATQRIKDGQKIRINGTEGYVELLS